MKKLCFAFLLSSIGFAQTNTEVYLFELSNTHETWKVGTGKNISNNEGYDSQPSFYNKENLLFSSTRNGQTDIANYHIKTGKLTFLNNTPNGGEYSPQRIPKSKNVSAVRLDTDGLQRFYSYNITTGKSNELIKDLKVAYPMWYDKNTILCVTIIGKGLDLIVHDRRTKSNTSIQKKVGRSLHAIPNSNLISYISKENTTWEVKSLHPKTGEIKKIINTIEQCEDICWLPDGTLLAANKNVIFKYNPTTDKIWTIFHRFPKEKFKNISRILVDKKGTKLALVSEGT